MKSNGRRVIRTGLAVCAFGLVMLPLGAAAQEDFELSIEPIDLEVLDSDVDSDSSKFQEYRDVSSGFRMPSLVINGFSAETDRHLSIFGENIWREDARMTATYGVWGEYAVHLDYNKIPHRFGNNGTLLWNVNQPGMLSLADSTQAQLQGALDAAPVRNFDLVDSLLAPYLAVASPIDLAIQRDRFDGRIELLPLQKFSFAIDYRHENRNGNRQYGGSFGFNNTMELPEPIDYETADIGVLGEWNGKRSGVQFGYRHSEFENDIDVLIWDNPFRAIDSTNPIAYLGPTTTTAGPTRGIYDLAPDNEADTLFVSGRSRFADDWWVSGKISSTSLSQDDPLQAYTLNTAIQGVDWQTGALFDPTTPATLPAQRANLEADLLSFDVDLGTDLGEDWKLKLMYDYYDYDASVPRLEFDGYVRMHAAWEDVPRVTVPYSYSRESLGAKVTWDVSRAGRVSGEFEVEEWDRENRETETTDEGVLTFTYDHDFGRKWDLRARWETGDREYDSYETEAQEVTFLDPGGINNQPGLRKYVQANREYDDYRFDLYYYPSNAVQVSFGLAGTDVDYPGGEFGLLSSELTSLDLEVSYVPGEDLTFFAFANLTEGESFQRARQSGATLSENPEDDWEASFDEDNDLFGLGLTARLASRLSTDVMAQWGSSDGFAGFFTPPGGSPETAEPIPNYDDYDLFFFRVSLECEIGERSRAGVWYWYEDYDLDTFLIDNLSNYEAGLIAINPNFADYQANVIGVYLSFDL